MPQKTVSSVIGRFAPSPTGPLHFGSLVTAIGSYCLARKASGRWRVRIEDLDTPRVIPGAGAEILRTLEGLGLEWDGEVVYQSRGADRYLSALEHLRRQGLVFDCGCSRREILASAPHAGEEGSVYPGTCRQGIQAGRRPRALRIRVPDKVIRFTDGIFGPVAQCLAGTVGDFVLRRADGLFAYQLAVVVDDADMGINQVVRGKDLLPSTCRQVYLNACMGYAVPHYIHLPLALTADGEKISKRHGPAGDGMAGAGGDLIWRALRFLGQAPPGELRELKPREVLAWGVAHFDLGSIPLESKRVEEGWASVVGGQGKR
jgi:glutamyl-Q tRNA(Asp) synthetase